MYGEIKEEDSYFISRTLGLARKAQGMTSPNPLVGAVLVKNGSIISEGYHEKAGMPHAEVVALEKAGLNAKGATLYVNLEPCSHFGKTPPCVHAIKGYGIKRVVAAMRDPNPLVAGKGFEYLKNNGINVSWGIGEKPAARLNEIFIKYITQKIPFITVKSAMTLDGMIGTSSKSGKVYISSIKSLKFIHRLRFLHDAILLSANTVIHDNPFLDVRFAGKVINKKFADKTYYKIILDRNLKMPADSKLFNSHGKVILFTSADYDDKKNMRKDILEEKGAIIRDVGYNIKNGDKKLLDLNEIFKDCFRFGISSILAEPGPVLFDSLIEGRLYDKLIFNITPFMLGNFTGLSLFKELKLSMSNEMVRLNRLEIKKIADEIFLSYYSEFH